MKKKFLSLLLPLSLIALFPLFAFADGGAPDLTSTILALWQGIQNHSGTAVILMAVFQLLRTNESVGILSKISGRYLQVVIAILTTLGFIANAWAQGQPLGQAAITGLFTSGGAMLVYQAIASINAHPADPAAAPAVKS